MKALKNRKREFRGRATKDGNNYTKPLKEPKNAPTIHQKLEVVRFYEKLLKEKGDAKKTLQEPRPRGAGRKGREAFQDKVKKSREALRRNLQKLCLAKFPCVKGAQVCKWFARSKFERWEEMPDAMRRASSSTCNEWVKKMGLAERGRPQGGGVPMLLQRELDVLIGEMTMGASTVSERREVVTADCIVSSHLLFEGFSAILCVYQTKTLR